MMRTLYLLLATAFVANNSGAQTPLTVDTNFRFYYGPDLLDYWESQFPGGNWQPGVSDVVLRQDGNIMVTGPDLTILEETPWGGEKSVIMDPTSAEVQEYLTSCGGRLFEILETNQYFSIYHRLNYDCSPDFTFGMMDFQFEAIDGWYVLPDRSVMVCGFFRITADDPDRYVLIKVDEWGEWDPSFTPRKGTGSNLGGRDMFPLANGQYLFNGTWATYEGRPCGPLIRINADGTQDTTFTFRALISNLSEVHEQPDGKTILGGQFILEDYYPDTLNLLRVNVDGSLDLTFNNFNHVTRRTETHSTARFATINTLEPLDDGRFVIGGIFTHIEEELRSCIACVDTAGNLLDCWANGGLGPMFYTASGAPIMNLGGFERLPNGETYLYGRYQGFIDSNGLHPEQCMISRVNMPDVGMVDPLRLVTTVSLMPNPGTDVLGIHLPGSVNAVYELADMTGRVLGSGMLRPGTTSVDTSTLPSAVYVLHVIGANGLRNTIKWIKQ